MEIPKNWQKFKILAGKLGKKLNFRENVKL